MRGAGTGLRSAPGHSPSPPRLPDGPFLYPLTDRGLGGAGGAELCRRLFAAGAPVVQLREKSLADRDLLAETRGAVDAARAAGRLLIVNDRVDVALLTGADGVHLGDSDLPVLEARALLGGRFLLGRSTHSVEEALAVAESPVDYVALGPIFGSATKPGRAPLGPEALRRVRERTGRKLVAIGGIDAARIDEVVEAGADGIAVIAAAIHPVELEERVQALLARLERWRDGPPRRTGRG